MLKKLSISLFVLLSIVFTQFAWAQSLRNAKDEATITRGEKISLPYQTIYLEGGEDVLFDNGILRQLVSLLIKRDLLQLLLLQVFLFKSGMVIRLLVEQLFLEILLLID